MTFLSVLWDFNPQIVDFLPPRWYGLLFGLAFILAQQIITHIYRTEGRNEKEIDMMLIYMVVGTIVGARLGHCLFYDWDHYTQDFSHIVSILYVWEGGLASHGGGIGLLVASYLFSKKYKVPSYLWLIDRIALVVVIGGALIRLGNFANSEIVGHPTNQSWGVVFVENARTTIKGFLSQDMEVSFDDRKLEAGERIQTTEAGVELVPLFITIELSKGLNAESATNFVHNITDYRAADGTPYGLNVLPDDLKFVEIAEVPVVKAGTKFQLKAWGIPRHPAQLYESISCLFIFALLFFIYKYYKGNTPDGLLFGLFAVLVFTLRFLYEFIKENQVAHEAGMVLKIGQKLSIPLVIAGFVLIVLSLVRKKKDIKS